MTEPLDPMDDSFEASLRRALAARPERELPDDLAARAMRRATAPARAAVRPAAVWRTVSSLAACLLIAALLSLGVWRWYRTSSGNETSATSLSDASTASAVNAVDATSSQNAMLLLVGGAVLVLSLGVVTLDRMLSADDAAGTPVFV